MPEREHYCLISADYAEVLLGTPARPSQRGRHRWSVPRRAGSCRFQRLVRPVALNAGIHSIYRLSLSAIASGDSLDEKLKLSESQFPSTTRYTGAPLVPATTLNEYFPDSVVIVRRRGPLIFGPPIIGAYFRAT